MRGGVGYVKLTFRRRLGLELACIEAVEVLKRFRGVYVNCLGEEGFIKVAGDVGEVLDALNRLTLTKEVEFNGQVLRPRIPIEVGGIVKSNAPHLRPIDALLLINLTGAVKGPLLDPFAGLGTIPKVASHVGIFSIGCDLYRLSDVKCDASEMPVRRGSIEAIATDPPFNRDFRIRGSLARLYERFLEASFAVLRPGGSLTMLAPSYLLSDVLDYSMSIGYEPYCISVDHVHGALSRYFLCLRKPLNQ